MKSFMTMILAGIFMMLWTNPAKADLPPEPWHCKTQENCFAILGNGNLYIDRKGVEKGPIILPSGGMGHISTSEGYVIATWVQDTIVWLYNIETGDSCFRDIGESCSGEKVVYGQEVFVGCPELLGMLVMPVDCSDHGIWHGFSLDYAESLSRGNDNNSKIYVTDNETNKVGYFEANPKDSGITYNADVINLGFIRYHEGNSVVYFSGIEDDFQSSHFGEPGIFSRDLPVQSSQAKNALVYVADEITHMAINDSHIFGSTGFSYGFLVDIANQSYTVINLHDSRANALSKDTLYIYDPHGGQAQIRAFDMQGNEKGFSPLLMPGYSIAYIEPTIQGSCNNGLIESGETCDSSDFDGQTCQDFGFGGGDLSCNLTCDMIGTINCWICGDGVKNENEECDSNDFGTAVCSDYGYVSGDLVCNNSCEIEITGCYTCGDGFIEGPEQCEVDSLNGGTCESEDFVSGTLTCGTDCMYDTSGCSTCGDDLINGQDLCDGSHITEGCQTLGMGFTGGKLDCNSTCDGYDTSGCTECGNGIIESGEECDLSDLDGASCSSLGFGTGAMSCYENCTYNVQDCSTPPTEACGNSVIDPGEECDDGNRAIGDGCDEECQLEPDQANCGNNIIEADEQCDGTDLGGITCESLGFMSGAVYCRSNCTLDAATCNYGNYQNTSLNIEPSASPDSGSFDEVQINAYNEITSTRTLDCDSSLEGEDLIFTTSADGYCPVELKYGGDNKAKIGVVFVMIYKPGNSLNDAEPILRIKQDGNLNIESGAHMRAHLWAYPSVTLGNELSENPEENVSLREEFLSVHPDTGEAGRFVLVEMAAGLNKYCSISNPDSCAVIVGGTKEVIDLDNLEDSLGKIGRDPKKSGCSVAGGSSGSSEIPVFMAFILLILALRIRRHN